MQAPFVLNILQPDYRNLLEASPYHFMTLNDRIDESLPLCALEFAGGHAYDLNEESASSSEEELDIEETKEDGIAAKTKTLITSPELQSARYIRKATV
jgi:hypothetical protein